MQELGDALRIRQRPISQDQAEVMRRYVREDAAGGGGGGGGADTQHRRILDLIADAPMDTSGLPGAGEDLPSNVRPFAARSPDMLPDNADMHQLQLLTLR